MFSGNVAFEPVFKFYSAIHQRTPLFHIYPSMDEAKFRAHIRRLRQFKHRHGRFPDVRESKKPSGLDSVTMKDSFESGELTADQIQKLLDLGFHFEGIKERELYIPADWNAAFEAFKSFYEKRQRLPNPTDAHGSIKVGRWLQIERIRFFRGHTTLEQFDKLRSVHESALFQDKKSDAWLSEFYRLEKFVKQKGAALSNDDLSEDKALHRWLACQADRIKYETMTKIERALLDRLGVEFAEIKGPVEKRENKRDKKQELRRLKIELIRKYLIEHERMPPLLTEYQGVRISTMCEWIKRKRKEGVLTEEEISLLSSVGFDWEPLN